jgi:hypothetical protein
MRLRCLLPLALLALLPASNAAAGGIPPTEAGAGPEGVVGPDGAVRFGALATGNGTVVSKTTIRDGRVLRAAVLQGRWNVPVVANDFTTGGLSADESTLVLARAFTSFPVRSTTFAVLGTGRLGTRRTIELKGKWSFDALSPDASTLYLIHTTEAKTSRYAVRAYDLRAGRLLADPIVDPSEPDEPMRGYPMTRTTSASGRWVYTLYAGGEHPFVHALDTVRRTSLCLDLPHRAARHAWSSRLAIRGARIQVLYRDRVIASASRRPQEASTGGGPPWAVALLLASGLIAAAGVRRVAASRSGRPRR